MATLGIPSNTIAVLQKYNFNFQKKFGQNFLIDTHVLEKIIAEAGITKEDCVVEIGPGIGTMTQYLAESAGHVVAVEIDRALIPILQDTLSPYDNVEVINEDILKVDLRKLVEERNGGRPVKVVANLPYYITTPIVMGLLESGVPLHSITIMVQKEVAERMQAGPGTKDYGALSLAVQYYAQAEVVANVPPNCFIPRPNVGSAVIRLTRYEKPQVEVRDEKLMFAIIRASFNQRRKMLANGLGNAPGLSVQKDEVRSALRAMGLSENIRGEAMTLAQFAQLSNLLAGTGEKMIKAVVFDMDGVLFDTERISCECCFEAARLLGVGITDEAVYGCFGLNAADGRAHVVQAMEKAYPGGSFPYDAYKRKHDELFAGRLETGVPVMEGVRELLVFLREKGIRMAVASSTNYARVMSNLDAGGLTGYFEEVITGNMVEHSKPQPDIYQKACDALGVRPQEAMAVEDSPNGIRSAKAAGMITVMIPDMVEPDAELKALYDLKFDSLRELKHYLEQL